MEKYRLKTSGWWFDEKNRVSYQECFVLADRFEEKEDSYVFYREDKNVFEVTKFVIEELELLWKKDDWKF